MVFELEAILITMQPGINNIHGWDDFNHNTAGDIDDQWRYIPTSSTVIQNMKIT